jgi:hypothetical protein
VYEPDATVGSPGARTFRYAGEWRRGFLVVPRTYRTRLHAERVSLLVEGFNLERRAQPVVVQHSRLVVVKNDAGTPAARVIATG